MPELFKYADDDPHFVNCRAMKIMDAQNGRALDAANQRIKRYNDQHKAMAVQVVQHDTLAASKSGTFDWFKTATDRLRQAGGGFKMLSFRLRLGRLLIEFQSAGRSSGE